MWYLWATSGSSILQQVASWEIYPWTTCAEHANSMQNPISRTAKRFGDDGEGSVQGVTELTECARAEDPWLLQVQNEMRDGNLSKDAWNFLHGRHTTVPGSFVDNRLTCNNPSCFVTWRTQKRECSICEQERRSKHRVMNLENDDRRLASKFLVAPAISPTTTSSSR